MCACAHVCVYLGWVHLNSASEFPTIIYTKFNIASPGPSCSKSSDASRIDTKVAKEQPLSLLRVKACANNVSFLSVPGVYQGEHVPARGTVCGGKGRQVDVGCVHESKQNHVGTRVCV